MSWSAADHELMARALQLARRGLYGTSPNPRVGCVLVRDGRVIAEGWHRAAGGPHAEIDALNKAGDAQGATCYVTLEPCIHTGRTPPCVDALIRARVGAVMIGMQDPNPKVGGGGVKALQAAGIKTRVGLLGNEVAALNPGFIMRMRAGRPYVRCKLAMSLDGRTAAADGDSKWITAPAARGDVQRLRARSCAVMTGIGTILADDPRLDMRLQECGDRQPLRVVVDRALRMPVRARMLKSSGRTLVATLMDDPSRRAALEAAGAELCMPDDKKGFLKGLLMHLAEHERINELLLEAGAGLAGAMLEAGLVDELVLYQAPVLLGDRGRPLFYLPDLIGMGDSMTLQLKETRRVGRDLRLVFTVPDAGTH